MTDPGPSPELADLLNAMADETLTPEQGRRLADLLRADPSARRHYTRHVQMLTSLQWHCQAVKLPAPSPSRPIRPWAWGLAAAAIVAVVVLAIRHVAAPPAQTGIASLDGATGNVVVLRADGHASVAITPLTLHPGDTVRVEDDKSQAVITYPDSTRLELTGGSVTLPAADRKNVALHSGRLIARVAPQPADQPMVLLTPRAEIRVLGTELALSADPARTDLAVTAGRVRVTPVRGQKSVQVNEGQFTVAREGAELLVRDMPRPPQRWSEDFEAGLPPGWLFGDFTATGLPAGSRGGVRASRIERPDGVYHEISTPKAWDNGLFAITDESEFHFTFRVQRAKWFQIFIITRPFDPDLPPTATYRFKDNSLWAEDVGQWKTVRIPLSRFERVSDWSGVPPLGEVPFQVLFSSRDVHPGLVIDRVGVERRKPGGNPS